MSETTAKWRKHLPDTISDILEPTRDEKGSVLIRLRFNGAAVRHSSPPREMGRGFSTIGPHPSSSSPLFYPLFSIILSFSGGPAHPSVLFRVFLFDASAPGVLSTSILARRLCERDSHSASVCVCVCLPVGTSSIRSDTCQSPW